MHILVKVIAACMVGVLLMSCAGRRARQAEMREQALQRQGSSCFILAEGACPVCNIQCPIGQPAVCTPGETADNTCKVQPSCKCRTP